MSVERSSKPYWYASAIVLVCLGGAVGIWKARNSAKLAEPEGVPTSHQSAPPIPKAVSLEVSQIPTLIPGDACDKTDKELGKPTEEDQYFRSWKKPDFLLTATADSTCHLTSIEVSVPTGHKTLTVDGITLGASTLGDSERILGNRLTEGSESVEAPEGNWVGILQLVPSPDRPYKVSYRAPLALGKAEALGHDPVFNDFRSLPVSEYSLEMEHLHSQAK